jgi:hypothetical protein
MRKLDLLITKQTQKRSQSNPYPVPATLPRSVILPATLPSALFGGDYYMDPPDAFGHVSGTNASSRGRFGPRPRILSGNPTSGQPENL